MIDPYFLHVFEWFTDLSRSRVNYVGMEFAFAPIRYSDIEAYMRLNQVVPHPVEVKLLTEVDSIFLELMNKKEKT